MNQDVEAGYTESLCVKCEPINGYGETTEFNGKDGSGWKVTQRAHGYCATQFSNLNLASVTIDYNSATTT